MAKWTESDERLLRQICQDGRPASDAARLLKRSRGAVYYKAERMGFIFVEARRGSRRRRTPSATVVAMPDTCATPSPITLPRLAWLERALPDG